VTRAIVALAAVAALATPARAADPDPAPAAAPRKLTIGVYVNHISGVDIKNSKFEVDFYVWFRWEGADDLKPLDTFELANGRVTSKTGVSKHTYGTQNYVSCRVLATITKFWDLRRFPLDDHTLELQIEDSDMDTRVAVFDADVDNANTSPDLHVPGWTVTAHRSRVITQTYSTNYGDVSLPQGRPATYSRYIFSIDVERPGYGRFLRVFFGLFISVLVAFTSFHVRPKESSPRVSLGVGATFAAAAVTVAINNSLPDTNAITMADKLIMLTLAMIVATVAETITVLALFARGKEDLQKRIDKICAIAFPAVYVLLLVVIVV
jgi:hypothetical protein